MWCDDTVMTPTTRRVVFAIGGFLALAIFFPSTVRGSFPGGQSLSSGAAGKADLGVALRVALGSEAAAIVSVPFERVWSKASGRGRFSLPVGGLARSAWVRTALAVALVLTALGSVRTPRLGLTASDPRAPPLLLQRQ